jgi:two-component system, chemotaxis family, sensor kinase Cph1
VLSRPWTASDLEAADELRRRAIEVDLERRLLSEQRAVRARDDLIAVVSHDLKNPLSATHMKALVEDLLDLARIETQRFTLHLEPVESRALLDEALLAALPLAEPKRITLAVDVIDLPRLGTRHRRRSPSACVRALLAGPAGEPGRSGAGALYPEESSRRMADGSGRSLRPVAPG